MKVFSLCLLAVVFLFCCTSTSTCQGLEYEIGIGPQLTKAVITDYSVGIVGNNKPSNDRYPVGYMLNLMVRNQASHLQIGLQLKNDYTSFNVYLPVQFPGDFDAKKTSRWDNYYEAFRLGAGCHFRYTMGNFFLQSEGTYMAGLSITNRHDFYFGKDGTYEKTEGKDYSSGSGFLLGTTIGILILKKANHSFAISAGVDYSFYKQEYTYELFLHYWKIRPIQATLMVSYKWIRADSSK